MVGLLDVDAFFAAAEVLRRPALSGLPLVVAYDHPRSVVSTASYEARKFSVHSGLPLALARRRCPDLVVVEPDFDWYQELSLECFATVAAYVDVLEPLSLDEALFPIPAEVSSRISAVRPWLVYLRENVLARTGLSVSVGAGPSRTIAKLAATAAKPAGVLFIPREDSSTFLASCRLASLPGVGPSAVAALTTSGLDTVADFQAADQASLPDQYVRLLRRVLEYGTPATVSLPPPAKSVSVVSTFQEDSRSPQELRSAFSAACLQLHERLSSAADAASTFSVRLRRADFSDLSRSRTVSPPVSSPDSLHSVLSGLFESMLAAHGCSFRSLALTASGFSLTHPASLFEDYMDRPHRWVPGERCAHRVFGPGLVILVAQDSVLVRYESGRRVRVLHSSSISPVE